MKSLLLIALGFILCLFTGIGLFAYQKITHPLGKITNKDFPLIEISRENGSKVFDLKKGESKELKYGEYVTSIPQYKTTIHIFKNNRGNCTFRISEGIVFVEVDENATTFSSPSLNTA
jgi:hypothetical protein